MYIERGRSMTTDRSMTKSAGAWNFAPPSRPRPSPPEGGGGRGEAGREHRAEAGSSGPRLGIY